MVDPITQTPTDGGGRLQMVSAGREAPQWLGAAGAFVLLLILGYIAEPRSLGTTALLSMLPFFAILAVASMGQYLVIRQRGLDLSVAGIISFAAVLMTNLPRGSDDLAVVLGVVLLVLLMGIVVGAISGAIITFAGVPALVTTIGVNAFMMGLVLWISNGTPAMAPPSLSKFALGRSFGIPNTIIVAAIFIAIVWFVLDRTAVGRRFLAVGISPIAARSLGVPVTAYLIGTYTFAGFCYAMAGVMLAGFLNFPSLFVGNDYLLATVAAVVVGGNSIAGDRGSVPAAVIGAAFMTYLGQLVLSLGFERSTQQIIQALVVLGAVGIPVLFQQVRTSMRKTAGART
jgi:ribose/xylose/arabinose/galactoside ABC-type transport system permease subunit